MTVTRLLKLLFFVESLVMSHRTAYRQPLGNMLKEPTHIQAHLVFAETQSPNKKPKELEFCQRTTKTY
jgi:hypothetical protein